MNFLDLTWSYKYVCIGVQSGIRYIGVKEIFLAIPLLVSWPASYKKLHSSTIFQFRPSTPAVLYSLNRKENWWSFHFKSFLAIVSTIIMKTEIIIQLVSFSHHGWTPPKLQFQCEEEGLTRKKNTSDLFFLWLCSSRCFINEQKIVYAWPNLQRVQNLLFHFQWWHWTLFEPSRELQIFS